MYQRSIQREKLHRPSRAIWVSFAFLISILPATAHSQFSGSLSNLRYSPLGNELILNACKKNEKCQITFIDIDSNQVRRVPNPPNAMLRDAALSPDGDQLAAILVDKDSGGADGKLTTRLITMKRDGSEMRIWPGRETLRRSPIFTHDGKAILANTSDVVTRKRLVRLSGFSALDLTTGLETQLLKDLLYDSSKLSYGLTPQQFVFSAEGWTKDVRIVGIGSAPSPHQVIAFKYPSRNFSLESIYNFGDYISRPTGEPTSHLLAFIGRTNRIDNIPGRYRYDIFQLDGDGHKRLTNDGNLKGEIAISPDGKRMAYLTYLATDGSSFGLRVIELGALHLIKLDELIGRI